MRVRGLKPHGYFQTSLRDFCCLGLDGSTKIIKNKRGATPAAVAPILERLGLDAKTWCDVAVEDSG